MIHSEESNRTLRELAAMFGLSHETVQGALRLDGGWGGWERGLHHMADGLEVDAAMGLVR